MLTMPSQLSLGGKKHVSMFEMTRQDRFELLQWVAAFGASRVR